MQGSVLAGKDAPHSIAGRHRRSVMRVGCCIHSPTQRVRQKSTIHILDGHPRHIPGNFFKWFLKQIANHKALADVKVSERVKMERPGSRRS